MTSKRIVVRWYEHGRPQYRCLVRGILPDRRFYGEILACYPHGGKSTTAQGRLSEPDYTRLLQLVDKVEAATRGQLQDGPCEGMLAEGLPANPRIIFLYNPSVHATTQAGILFRQITQLLLPYLQPFMEMLKE
ncbi:hypothetical protein JCM19992_00930 [Thermostilla marina]